MHDFEEIGEINKNSLSKLLTDDIFLINFIPMTLSEL